MRLFCRCAGGAGVVREVVSHRIRKRMGRAERRTSVLVISVIGLV